MAASDERLQLLDRRLAALNKSRPDLAQALELQEQLVRASLASARPPQAQPFPIPREHLAARVREGVPVLHDQPVQIDVHYAADLFSRLVNTLQEREDADLAPRLDAVATAALNGQLDPQTLFAEAFVQHHAHLNALAEQAQVDPELLVALATQSVAPLLRAYADRLAPLVAGLDDGSPEAVAWHFGYCPVCGGWPLLAELRGIELSAHLRCAACGTAWRWRRIGCAYCRNDDFRSLQVLTIEGEQRFKISVCDRCHGYLKVINSFDPPPADLLVLDDVASVHLDVAAIERGYHRPVGSGYVIELALPDDGWRAEADDD